MLLRWLRAQYPSQHIPEDTWTSVRRNSTWDAHDRITEVFLDLARTQHTEGVMEPDVQIALGVLFYNNNDFDRAKDCFEAALSARPKVTYFCRILLDLWPIKRLGLFIVEPAWFFIIKW